MNNYTRKVLDTSFGTLAQATLALLIIAAAAFIVPIAIKKGAVVFRASVEHDKFRRDNLDAQLFERESGLIASSDAARAKFYSMQDAYEDEAAAKPFIERIEAARTRAFSKLSRRSAEIVAAASASLSERKNSATT